MGILNPKPFFIRTIFLHALYNLTYLLRHFWRGSRSRSEIVNDNLSAFFEIYFIISENDSIYIRKALIVF